MKKGTNPQVFRNHMIMLRGMDYRIIQGKIEFAAKLKKWETYTVYWYPKDPGRYEIYNSLGELTHEGVLTWENIR